MLLLGVACPWRGKHLPKHLREATQHPSHCSREMWPWVWEPVFWFIKNEGGEEKVLSQPEGLSYGKTVLIAEKCEFPL